MSANFIDGELSSLKDAVAMALEFAKGLGSSAAEVAISKQQGLSVSSRLQEVETVEFNKDGALGITVYRDGCKGNSSTSDLSPEAIREAVKAADSIARYTSEDPAAGLAEKSLMATEFPNLELYHPRECSPQELAQLAIAAEAAALGRDKRISNSDGASANAHNSVRVYGNSHGFLQGYCSSRYSLSCVVIGSDDNGDMQRDYDYTVARRFDDMQAADVVGVSAADKTLARLGGRRLPTGTLPVLFAADVATGLIGHLVSAISGSSLYRKSSFLLDSLGQPIFPEWLSIHEQPQLVGGFASANYDSEGVATRERFIVQQGILQSYLLTSYSARKLGLENTGHAGGIYNWTVADSGKDFQQLIRSMDKGLIVTEVMGQGVNLVTGDYSRGAAGFYVENGEIRYPVEEITIAGNLRDMFRNIQAIASDREMRSPIRTGGILLDSMKIAGS
ncbi:metalloprotease PmbA [Shewanella sp. YIC-542]|uniref:metalloprotease PmbA n=1 Tax=Shewanella mytili TaxID=3377111 RepID=UPI00398E3503